MPKEPEPTRSEWNEFIGPFYSVSRVAGELHLTEEEVEQRTKDNELLGLEIQEGDLVFPSYQFTKGEDGESTIVVPGIPEILKVFGGRSAEEAWTLASWLNAYHRDLDGKRLIDYLKETKDIEKPLLKAREAAWRWSH